MNLAMEPQTPLRDPERQNPGWWQRLVAGLPMRTALAAVAAVWLFGCVWSYQEQSDFAAAKGFVFPHLLPLVIDGFAVSMAGVAWAASLDARPAVPARLATLIAVGTSSASNGVWAWLRANHDLVTVAIGVAVPIAANLAFEVLLAELRRQVQRKRGLPPPVAVPYPRLIRLVLAPWKTFFAWRCLVLDLTDLAPQHQLPALPPAVDGELVDEVDPERWWASAPPAGYFDLPDRARHLIASGVGRRRLSKELDISEYEARQLLERTRPTNHSHTAVAAGNGPADAGEEDLT